MSLPQVNQVESSVRFVSERCPGLRVDETILCRTAVILARDLTSSFDAQLAPFGLAELEYRLLLNLFARGGSANPGELCTALAQSPANLTRVGDLLEERGLLTRAPDEEDRRRQILTITRAGRDLVQQLLPQLMQTLDHLFKGFSDEDRARFLDYMKRLVQAVDQLPDTRGSPA